MVVARHGHRSILRIAEVWLNPHGAEPIVLHPGRLIPLQENRDDGQPDLGPTRETLIVGVLALPAVMKYVGWIPGLGLIFLLALGAIYSGTLISRLWTIAHHRKIVAEKYGDLGRCAYGVHFTAVGAPMLPDAPEPDYDMYESNRQAKL